MIPTVNAVYGFAASTLVLIIVLALYHWQHPKTDLTKIALALVVVGNFVATVSFLYQTYTFPPM